MGVPETSEKGQATSPADLELSASTITSTQEHHPKKLHVVQRSDVIPEYDGSEENITGYDADLMRARASLSAEEEKKLLRRVDWRIVPLCAVMYAVKSIDASNVSIVVSWDDSCLQILRSPMPGSWTRVHRTIS